MIFVVTGTFEGGTERYTITVDVGWSGFPGDANAGQIITQTGLFNVPDGFSITTDTGVDIPYSFEGQFQSKTLTFVMPADNVTIA